MGNTIHHIKNNLEFVLKIKEIKLKPEEKLVSFDITTLFTSIQTADAIQVLRSKLAADDHPSDRTKLNIEQIIKRTTCCLDFTYFTFSNIF